MHEYLSYGSRLCVALILFSIVFLRTEQNAACAAANVPDGTPLYLEVYINKQPTKLVAAFVQDKDGRFWSQRKELRELKLDPPAGDEEQYVSLDQMSALDYRYDEATQRLDIQAGDEARAVARYNARGSENNDLEFETNFGGVLNYNVFASTHTGTDKWKTEFDGLNIALDGRVFGPFGVFSQSAILGTTTLKNYDALRLDTTWSYSSPESQVSYRAGDVISGGLTWTRPIRLGGLQIQRNFNLRPDLVTVPLPKFSGSAALPSTVDVYVNNIKSYSQSVDSGPFEISNIPVVGRGGTARVVLNDAQGRQTSSELPFFVSPRMLKAGLLDFSLEAGFARFNYGIESFDYDADLSVSATVRYGVTDQLTLEGHGEFTDDLVNAGVGATLRLGQWGVASAAFSISEHSGDIGTQVYAAYDTTIMGANLHVSTKRSFGSYDDLASVTGRRNERSLSFAQNIDPKHYLSVFDYRTPKAIDTASLSIPLTFDNSTLNLSYVHLEDRNSETSNLVSVSYSRPLWKSASAYVTGFADLDDSSDIGIFAGVSIPLGGATTALVGMASDGHKVSPSLSASKSLGSEPGSYGWRVDVTEGDIAQQSAFISTRTKYATVEAGVRHQNDTAQGSLEISGALATLDGGVYAANRIDDSFAVVKTGYADSEVLYENRKIGRTDSSGKILVTNLRAYQKNKISVDALSLPLDAELVTTSNHVVPSDRAGVVVDMTAKDVSQSALIALVDSSGVPLAPGSEGKVVGAEGSFIVGYDGQAYIDQLPGNSELKIQTAAGSCNAQISRNETQGSKSLLGPFVCQ